MARRKPRRKTKESTRNLRQYADLTDEEFEDRWAEINSKSNNPLNLDGGNFEEFNTRVEEKMEAFGKDYDLTDMKYNDTQILRRLCSDLVTLEDYEKIIFELRSSDEINYDVLSIVDTLTTVIDKLNKGISKMQDDLKISRKARTSDKELDLISEIESQKKAASKYLTKVMSYIYCEKCNMLLSTTWSLYPEENNMLSFTCHRTTNDETGELCGHVTTITTKELLEKKGTNHFEGFKF